MNNLSADDMHLLQAWLDETLPKEERQALENRLNNEPELRAGAEEMRVLLNKLHILRRQEWQHKLKTMHFESLDDLEKIAKRGRLKWIWWVAIGVAVFFSILLMYKNLGKSTEPLSPIAQVSTEFDAPIWNATTRGSEPERLLIQAGNAYKFDRNFKKAAKKLEQYIEKTAPSEEVTIMLIVSYLKIGDGVKAWPYLQKMDENDRINWYKALALIQMNKLPQARRKLENLVAMDGDFTEKAKKLLKKMEAN